MIEQANISNKMATVLKIAGASRLVPFVEGIGLYLVWHVAFWKPKPVYLLGHRILQKLFELLLGGQVGTLPPTDAKSTQGPTVQGPQKSRSGPQVLAAVSPALIPVHTLFVTAVLGVLRATRAFELPPTLLLLALGVTTALHLVMAIETLQETRKQQTFIGYLLTLELMSLSTLGLTIVSLAFLLPDLSVGSIYQQAFNEALAFYAVWWNELRY